MLIVEALEGYQWPFGVVSFRVFDFRASVTGLPDINKSNINVIRQIDFDLHLAK